MRIALPLLTATWVSAGGMAFAHPHAHVDQQVEVSIGLDTVDVVVRIVPSPTQGQAIFDHIDSDGDGLVSDAEASSFGNDVIDGTRLEVDGLTITLGTTEISVPPAEAVSVGSGVIEIKARASVSIDAGKSHTVSVSASYQDLAHEWFIQPYFFPDLAASFETQDVERGSDAAHVQVHLQP